MSQKRIRRPRFSGHRATATATLRRDWAAPALELDPVPRIVPHLVLDAVCPRTATVNPP